MSEYVPTPARGRIFTASYVVRLADSTPSRRVRLDAIARYLQDVAEDDAADSLWPRSIGWVLRRTAITLRTFPTLGETLQLETFCSATASKWAERTTTITGDRGASVQASAVWVAIDVVTGRPARLGETFERVYEPSAEGRRASVRLSLPTPPPEALERAIPWPLRSADFDVWGHANNAISWVAAEDALSSFRWLPERAELEHNEAMNPGDSPMLATNPSEGWLDIWLVDGPRVLTSARLHHS